jgi:hypothetical protein
MQTSSTSVDRRVTFDRAVRTKPLAFAADAGHQLCILNRGPRPGAPADEPGRRARGHREDVIDGPVDRGRPRVSPQGAVGGHTSGAPACAPSVAWSNGRLVYDVS